MPLDALNLYDSTKEQIPIANQSLIVIDFATLDLKQSQVDLFTQKKKERKKKKAKAKKGRKKRKKENSNYWEKEYQNCKANKHELLLFIRKPKSYKLHSQSETCSSHTTHIRNVNSC